MKLTTTAKGNNSFSFFILLSLALLVNLMNAGAAILISNGNIIQTSQKEYIKQGNYILSTILYNDGTYSYDSYSDKKLLFITLHSCNAGQEVTSKPLQKKLREGL